MSICNLRRSLSLGAPVAVVAAGACARTSPGQPLQRRPHRAAEGRHYDPTDLFLRRGDTITLVNGDDSAVHHAFIDADRFSFDGGDEEPGKQATLILTESGDFVIQCGIHPKMKLTVHVQ